RLDDARGFRMGRRLDLTDESSPVGKVDKNVDVPAGPYPDGARERTGCVPKRMGERVDTFLFEFSGRCSGAHAVRCSIIIEHRTICRGALVVGRVASHNVNAFTEPITRDEFF